MPPKAVEEDHERQLDRPQAGPQANIASEVSMHSFCHLLQRGQEICLRTKIQGHVEVIAENSPYDACCDVAGKSQKDKVIVEFEATE